MAISSRIPVSNLRSGAIRYSQASWTARSSLTTREPQLWGGPFFYGPTARETGRLSLCQRLGG